MFSYKHYRHLDSVSVTSLKELSADPKDRSKSKVQQSPRGRYCDVCKCELSRYNHQQRCAACERAGKTALPTML